MYLNTRADRALWTAAMERDNAAAYAAILHGARDLADNPLPEEDLAETLERRYWAETDPDDEPGCADCDGTGVEYDDDQPGLCENCDGTGRVTRDGPLGHVERRPCPECQGEWW